MLLWVFSPCMSTSSLMDTFYELLTCSTWDITGLNQSYRGTQWNTRLHLCNVSDTVSSLLQTDGQIELQGGLRGKWEEGQKWGLRAEKGGICWLSDNLRIRLWSRNQTERSKHLPTSAWHCTAKSFPWKLYPSPPPVVCVHFAAG